MPSVLVIDDEPAIRDAIQQVLGRSGFEVITADNGVSGVKTFFERPTDLVIVDIIMPRSDGIAVIKQIRETYPGARILAMTGGGNFGPLGYKPDAVITDAYLALASKSGADAVMTKPFRRHELIAAVRGLIAN